MVIASGNGLGHIIVLCRAYEYGYMKTAATIARFARPLCGCILAAYFEERSMVEDVELNRLYWHSRRGMLELDVLLVPFVKEVYPTLNDVDRELYRRLLTCEDQDMFGWFMQRAESEDAELQRMVRMILDRVQPK
jgi:antitoxin CptB